MFLDFLDAKSIEPAFTIHDPPSSSANLELIRHLLQQDEDLRIDRISSQGRDQCTRIMDSPIFHGEIHGGFEVSTMFSVSLRTNN